MEELYKPVKGYGGSYEVSNLGNVKNLGRYVNCHHNSIRLIKERILKQSIDTYGYPIISLNQNGKRKTRTVHQLVVEAFLNHNPCAMKLVVNHINFNKKDNRVENLEIVTSRVNSNRKHLKSSSQYTGVTKERGKWRAQIVINKKKKYLGFFVNEIDAHNAYQDELKSLI